MSYRIKYITVREIPEKCPLCKRGYIHGSSDTNKDGTILMCCGNCLAIVTFEPITH